ncbi:uncharacterized protein LOC110751234 [Prunus avium]|uniref:Uncharacterized protein LOC110751234 n=1 Tax=Prunus avium TaxID=42229 RepID=A0A6P5RR87_PRUAV|nr:uncharacterized protein LOC110751234 [Prunus avium]
MAADLISPSDPEFKRVPKKIKDGNRYWPYFKNCIGAIDGTHVPVVVPRERQVPYIGRKGITTQNIMVVCEFNMCFTFAWAAWEGSAHDARIFMDALRIPTLKFPRPPTEFQPYDDDEELLPQTDDGRTSTEETIVQENVTRAREMDDKRERIANLLCLLDICVK